MHPESYRPPLKVSMGSSLFFEDANYCRYQSGNAPRWRKHIPQHVSKKALEGRKKEMEKRGDNL